MDISVFGSTEELGKNSALHAAGKIREALEEKGTANIILATGTSQFNTIQNLVQYTDIDWSRIVMFHLDEYAGLPVTHPASFRKYLKERFVAKVPALKGVHFIEGDAADPDAECERLSQIITGHPIDVALVGIGENGHLAFNDPPADFETDKPYIVVTLDEECRRQQMGEGWFDSIDDVPEQAISMSVRHIMKSKQIICSVPDERKANAVRNCFEGPVTNQNPASILQEHPSCSVYLDKKSSSLLSETG
ncbi:MAG: glucosamine-6-phosphate deaminase [Balneolales bacterium]